MASIISAGTTSGTSLNLSGDTSGVLQLASNGSTTAVTIDTSQNVGIGTASPVARLQAVGTDGTAGGTNTLLRLLGNIGGTNKSGGLFFRTLNSTTVGTERIALIQSTDVDNNDRVLALNSTGGNVLIGTTTNNASGGVLQVSNGITFPATQSASSDANTLDDYEEGTWTPVIIGSSTAGTGTYSVQNGRYTKIGNRVYFGVYCSWSAHTGTGDMTMGGLPFTSNPNNFAGVSIRYSNLTCSTDYICTPIVADNNTVIVFQQSKVGAAASALGQSLDVSADVIMAGHYFV